MGRTRLALGAPLILLAGCGGAPETAEPVANVTAPTPTPSAATPVSTPVAADTAEAAADVVRRYHALIAEKRYADAYRLWEPDAVGMSAGAFAASFDKYAAYTAQVGAPGDIDAGAGQRYVTVPVRITGSLTAGGDMAMAGSFTLHRVADIDGATPEQRAWRIRSSDLKPRPGDVVAQPERVTARYRCIDGRRLVAAFDNGAGTVTLRRGGETLGVLKQQPAASGIWYRGGGLELRGKGDAAMFGEPGQPPIACTAIR